MRRVVGEIEKELFRAMAPDELRSLLGEHLGQVAPVRARETAVAIEPPLPIGLPAAAEAGEFVESAAVRMIARIDRAVVPLPDQPGHVSGGFEEIGDRAFAQSDSVESPHLERIDRAGAMRIAAGEQRRAGGRAHRRGRIVLSQTKSLVNELIEHRRARRAIVEASEIAVAHVVGEYEDDIWPFSHRAPSWRLKCCGSGGSSYHFGPTPPRFALVQSEALSVDSLLAGC